MSSNDGVIYSAGKSGVLPSRKHEAVLITLERFQKLDLLIHLITNLKASLVLCGPKGIGKTRLLTELIKSKKDEWPIITIQGSSNLSFESIQDQLSRSSEQYFPEYKNLDVSGLLNSLNKTNQKIVLIVDAAGQLMPGLIDMIIQYAASNACLRIIFSLTHDELHIKNSSDRAIDDCHYIEMPPLTEKQCGIFLQSLSSQPNAIVSFKAINNRLIGKLYKETHGIPGRIVSELPKLSNYNAGSSYKWFGLVLIGGGLVFMANTFIPKETNSTILNKVNLPLLLKEPNDVEITNPVIDRVENNQQTNQVQAINNKAALISDSTTFTTNTLIDSNNNSPTSSADPLQKPEEIIDLEKTNSQKNIGQPSEDKNIEVVEIVRKPTVEIIKVIPKIETKKNSKKIEKSADVKIEPKPQQEKTTEINHNEWVMLQPQLNYTIQLMVLSQLKSVHAFMKKNEALKNKLKFFEIRKASKKQFILIYGSFKNTDEVSKEMKTLPKKFRKSWVRNFSALQGLIEN